MAFQFVIATVCLLKLVYSIAYINYFEVFLDLEISADKLAQAAKTGSKKDISLSDYIEISHSIWAYAIYCKLGLAYSPDLGQNTCCQHKFASKCMQFWSMLHAGMYKTVLIRCIIFPMTYFVHPSKKHNCILYVS